MNEVFALALALCALATLLIIHPPWRRKRSTFGERLLELSGRARDVEAGGFTLHSASGRHRVRLDVGLGARLPHPREGSRVRVRGVVTQLRADETLYRDSGLVQIIDAVDLTKIWRERGLRLATVVMLALCMTFAIRLYLRTRTPLKALIARTAAQIDCPAGTERVTLGGAAHLFTHYCRDPAGNKHGPYGVWTDDGRVRERGTYRRGVRVGSLIEVDPPLFHREHCAYGGAKRGPKDGCPVIARVSQLDDAGRRHGMSYGYYYPRQQRAYIGAFRRDRRVGTWHYFHPKGHTLYEIDYSANEPRYTYYDQRTARACSGGSEPAVRWQLSKPDERCTLSCERREAACVKAGDKPAAPNSVLDLL